MNLFVCVLNVPPSQSHKYCISTCSIAYKHIGSAHRFARISYLKEKTIFEGIGYYTDDYRKHVAEALVKNGFKGVGGCPVQYLSPPDERSIIVTGIQSSTIANAIQWLGSLGLEFSVCDLRVYGKGRNNTESIGSAFIGKDLDDVAEEFYKGDAYAKLPPDETRSSDGWKILALAKTARIRTKAAFLSFLETIVTTPDVGPMTIQDFQGPSVCWGGAGDGAVKISLVDDLHNDPLKVPRTFGTRDIRQWYIGADSDYATKLITQNARWLWDYTGNRIDFFTDYAVAVSDATEWSKLTGFNMCIICIELPENLDLPSDETMAIAAHVDGAFACRIPFDVFYSSVSVTCVTRPV